jgi:hypothetical protein
VTVLCLAAAFLCAATAAIVLPMGGLHILLGVALVAFAVYWLLVADADIRLARLERRRGR